MSLLTTISGTDLVSPTKINAVINTVNEIGGGGINQRLVKNSNTDFDYDFVNGDFWLKCNTSVNITELVIGSTITLNVPFNSFNVKSGLNLKFFSVSEPSNWFTCKIVGTGTYGTANIDVLILSKNGSASYGDLECVPYFAEETTDTTITESSTQNGDGITVSIVTGGPFTYGTDSYKYSYFVDKKICTLNFKVVFTVTDGASLSQINIPLPNGLIKDTTITEDYAFRGMARLSNPLGVTNQEVLEVVSNKDTTEGQRLVLYRAGGGGTDLVLSTSSVVTLTGSILFKTT